MSNNEQDQNENQGQEPSVGISAGVLDSVMENAKDPQTAEPPTKEVVDPKKAFISPNVTIERAILEPTTEKADFPLHLFRQTDSEISADLVGFKNVDPNMGEEGRKWVAAVRGAQKMRVSKKLFENLLTDPESDQRQYITAGSQRVYAREVSAQVLDRNISGIRAINHLRHVMFMGEDREIPLFASGFHVTLRALPDTELSNLETIVLSEKEEIGRLTGGAALSATSVYLVDHVAQMIIQNMVKTNVELASQDELLDLILVTDLQHLALGQSQSIFPKGYPIEVPCTANYEVCQHIQNFHLQLRYMVTHENRKLTDYQRVQMADADRKLTKKDILKYQEEGPVKISKTVEVHGGKLSMDFRTPTLRQYIEDSRQWIAGIAGMVDLIVTDEHTDQQRRVMVQDQARLTTLRQYGHFIKSITIVQENGTSSTITDRETLLQSISDLSADDEVLKKVVEGVRDHIEAATISTVGVPKTPCPICEKDVVLTDEEKKHPRMIPVDALNLFFILLSLKLTKRQQTKLQDI